MDEDDPCGRPSMTTAPAAATIVARKPAAAADEQARVWDGRGVAQYRWRSGSDTSSARLWATKSRAYSAANTVTPHDRRPFRMPEGPIRGPLKSESSVEPQPRRNLSSRLRLGWRRGRSTRGKVGGSYDDTGATRGGRRWLRRRRRSLPARLCGGAGG